MEPTVFLPYSRRLECLIIDRCKTKAVHPSLSLSVILSFWMPIRPGCEHGPTTPNWDTQTIELNIYSQRFWMASVHHGLTVPLQGWCNMRIAFYPAVYLPETGMKSLWHPGYLLWHFLKKNFPMAFYNAVILVVKDRLISRFSLFVILSVQCGTCDTKPRFRSL